MGENQGPSAEPKKSLSGAKLALIIVVAVVAAIVIVAAIGFALLGWGISQVAESFDATLEVNHSEWRYESPSGFHTSRGDYYLWANMTVANSGRNEISVSAFSFEMFWVGSSSGERGTADWSSFELSPDDSATVSVAFASEGLVMPDRVDFQYSIFEGDHVDAAVPTPSGPEAEAVLEVVSSEWKDVDTFGLSPSPGNQFLWLTLSVTNRWDEPLSFNIFYFDIEGMDGTGYSGADGREGPDQVAAGATAAVTIVFEVPNTWTPDVLYYDMIGGPWTDVSIPTPSG